MPSSDEGSGGMAQSGDSKAGTVPHMDIKPGPSKKDAYKGYHQIQMSEEDKEKTVFYTDQGTFCYTKMPFGLKNVRATYQRLVDSAFQTELGRNLEAYLDDMVIKSRAEKDMIMDVMETFDNLKKINMKLNPKKCSFGVKEGKFLGYMVTSEGIRAIPKKTKAVAEQAFQDLKTVIMELPTLTTPNLKETLYVYLAASSEAISGVLMEDRRGNKHNLVPVRAGNVEICSLANNTKVEEWTLFTDGASSLKGVGAGIVSQTTNSREDEGPDSQGQGRLQAGGFPDEQGIRSQQRLNGQIFVEGKRTLGRLRRILNRKCTSKPKSKGGCTKQASLGCVQSLDEGNTGRCLKRQVCRSLGGKRYCRRGRNNWMTPIIKCIEEGIWPEDENEARILRMKIGQYVMEDGIREIHEGAGEMHAGARSMVAKIIRQGYYWPSMHRDIKEVIDQCDSCQIHGPVPKLPKTKLTSIMSSERVGWVDELPNILWAHRMMLKTSNYETSFSLTYKSEVVILVEIGMPTYRIIQWNEAPNKEEMRLNLDLIQERRETAAIREAKYKKKMEQYYNKRVRPVSFKTGDFVYHRNEASRVENQGKLGPNWEGPYRVVEAYKNGSYKLCTMNDREVPRTWHAINLQNYFM
nr:reverse transcriptase domain-containing protein [Tanacetum cinerariifolium]